MSVNFKKIFLYSQFCFLIVLLCSSCSSVSRIIPYKQNPSNQKINNLIDTNGNGKSNLVFWNFKGPGHFFELADFPDLNFETTGIDTPGGIPVYGDFSGDGICDYGLYKQSEGSSYWTLIDGSTKSTIRHRYGEASDLPVPNDYDGDGICDYVVYRPKNSGFYGYLSNKNKLLEIHFGLVGDLPVPKDYDGDGWTDLATYRSISGIWQVKSSRNGLTKYITLGGPEYLPIPSDYDGDGKADLAVWNYKKNDCSILFSSSKKELSKNAKQEIKDKLISKRCFPISSDFDGDGKSELAFWEAKAKTIHFFKVENNSFKYKKHEVSFSDTSEPINYFLLKKYLNKPLKINLTFLLKKCSETATNKENSLICDFDGDGKEEKGSVDLPNNSFSYTSSASDLPVSIILDKRVNGLPVAYDIDSDFMCDLIFYNKDSNIAGFIQSSNNYRYDEIFL